MSQSIQASNPMIIQMGENQIAKSVAVEFRNGDKLVSLALDNSGGRMATLRRGDIRIFVGQEDVTTVVFGKDAAERSVHATLHNIDLALAWLRRAPWGFAR
jgi:hypothetical protein